MDSKTKGRKHNNWVTSLICVVSKSGSWIFCPAAQRCVHLYGRGGAPMCLRRSCELHVGKQQKTTTTTTNLATPVQRQAGVFCSPRTPQAYTALVSWGVLCLQTPPDAWLHGTDTAPSGSSPPPRRGRRILGVLTERRSRRQTAGPERRAERWRRASVAAPFLPLWPRWGWV